MTKWLASTIRRILGRLDKDMLTSFFMAIGSIMIPIGFLLIISSYEFNKPALYFWAYLSFAIGFLALFYSFRRALRDERESRGEKKKLDKNSADRHNEMKMLLQSINDKLSNIGKRVGK